MANEAVKVLEAPNQVQAESLWPWATANAHNIDRDLSKDDQPEGEFAAFAWLKVKSISEVARRFHLSQPGRL